MSKKRLIAGWVILIGVIVLGGGVYLYLYQGLLIARFFMPKDNKNFAQQIQQVRAKQKWHRHADYRPKLSKAILSESFAKGRAFLLANQKPAGNFNYEYNFVEKKLSKDDNQVRQAGALWGIALCHQYEQTPETRAALERGLNFFFENSRPGPDNSLLLFYPGSKVIETGGVALISLAIIDYLRADNTIAPDRRRNLEEKLNGYLVFLRRQQLPDGDFSRGALRGVNIPLKQTSPYFDGETLLALIKAAKYMNRQELKPIIEKAVAYLPYKYTVRAWRDKLDSDQTKSFYQWGTMAFWEYVDAGWPASDVLADTVLALAWWQINTHRILSKGRNSAYAYEGLLHAYLMAEKKGEQAAVDEIAYVIDKGLYRLTSWQVEGPLVGANRFLSAHRTSDSSAIGGVMNEDDKAPLRIDVTQHQMHAVVLALRHIYTN